MNVEKVNIQIKLSPTFWDQPPRAKVYVDSTVIFQGAVDEPKHINWEGTLIEGDHAIKIVYHSKDYRSQTVIDEQGIRKDQMLNIDGIIIDDIDLGFVYQQKATYITENNVSLDTTINLGENGTWSLAFSSPVYIWLLENL